MSTNLHRFLAAAIVFASVCSVADPLRQRAQAERGRTWVLAENGLFLEEAGKPRRPLGLVGWQRIVEPYSCPPDIAIGPGGEAVVTSNAMPVLWRVDPATLEVSVHALVLDTDNDKDFGFSSLVYSKRAAAYFAVSDLGGSVWKIDAALRHAQKVALIDRADLDCVAQTPTLSRENPR